MTGIIECLRWTLSSFVVISLLIILFVSLSILHHLRYHFRLYFNFCLSFSFLWLNAHSIFSHFLPYCSAWYLHIQLISLVRMFGTRLHAWSIFTCSWREVFLINLNLLLKFVIGYDLSKECFTVISKDEITNIFAA